MGAELEGRARPENGRRQGNVRVMGGGGDDGPSLRRGRCRDWARRTARAAANRVGRDPVQSQGGPARGAEPVVRGAGLGAAVIDMVPCSEAVPHDEVMPTAAP